MSFCHNSVILESRLRLEAWLTITTHSSFSLIAYIRPEVNHKRPQEWQTLRKRGLRENTNNTKTNSKNKRKSTLKHIRKRPKNSNTKLKALKMNMILGLENFSKYFRAK